MEYISGYDEWKTTLPEIEQEVVEVCDDCGRDLYEGDMVIEVNGMILCEDCIHGMWRTL